MRDSASAAKFPKWTPIPTQRRLFPFVLPPPSFFSYRSSPGILHHPSGNAESTVQWRSNQRAVSLSNPINSQARHPRCLATATLFWIVSSVICWCSGWVTRQWFYFLDSIYLLFFFFFLVDFLCGTILFGRTVIDHMEQSQQRASITNLPSDSSFHLDPVSVRSKKSILTSRNPRSRRIPLYSRAHLTSEHQCIPSDPRAYKFRPTFPFFGTMTQAFLLFPIWILKQN